MQVNRESVETTRETPKRTFTIEHRQNLSKAMTGRIPWNKGLTKADPRVLKNTQATQTNPNLRRNLSLALMGHASTFFRKHTSDEIEKIRRAHAGRKKHYAVWNKGKTKATDPRLARVGRRISTALLAKPESWRQETSRKAKMALVPYRVSKLEKAVLDALVARGANVIPQYPIRVGVQVTQVDLYFPDIRLCVYIDGTYWHSRPEVVRRDARIETALAAAGYQVLRFPDDGRPASSIADSIWMKI